MKGETVFTESARYYDKIYAFKDYRAEAEKLVDLIGGVPSGKRPTLLDVACGTGHHLEHLREHFEVEGLDLDPVLLEMARERNPGVVLHHGDMTDFNLGRTFDIVTCLFSSIGYVKTLDNLRRAASCLARHVAPGGCLVVEPWFAPQDWRAGTPHAMLIDEPELKIARVSTSLVDGRISYFDLHYLIATPEGTSHAVERHELGLFEVSEMREAFTDAGLDIEYDPEGLTGRGLYVCQRPVTS